MFQINSPNKYSNSFLNWPDSLMQFCEKQGLQAINIPAYSQNNASLNAQTHNLPMRIIQNAHIPQNDENIDKHDLSHIKIENEDIIHSTVSFIYLHELAIQSITWIE